MGINVPLSFEQSRDYIVKIRKKNQSINNKNLEVKNVPPRFDERYAYNEEINLPGSPQSIKIEILKVILEQIQKSICKIQCKKGQSATGFFCLIPFPDKTSQLRTLITNNHVLGESEIDIGSKITFSLNKEDKFIKIDDSRRVYTNKKYDITIIELKISDGIKNDSYLEIDDPIFKDAVNLKEEYRGKSVYLLHFPNGGEAEKSEGKIKSISEDNYNFEHLCETDYGSSGSPILNLNNNKLIGIHKGAAKNGKNWNLGTLIKKPIEEFKQKFLNNNNYIIKSYNNVDISNINNDVKNIDDNKNDEDDNFYLLDINNDQSLENNSEEDIIDEISIEYRKQYIDFRDNFYNWVVKLGMNETISEYKIFGEIFVKNNIDKCSIIYKGREYKLCSYLKDVINENIDNQFTIKLKGIRKITDCSYMFFGCLSLYSFPDIAKWDTKNITNMALMFGACKTLKSLPDISNWNTQNVTNFHGIFSFCKSLESLPDISKWNINRATQISQMFFLCTSLKELPDISKWNTENVENMYNLFRACCSIEFLPDISNWKTYNNVDLHDVFSDCHSLLFIPEISKWNTDKVTDMNRMFKNCRSLIELPDISKWNTSKVKNMNGMFAGCKSLESFPDISKWNIDSCIDNKEMFTGLSQKVISDTSNWNKIKNKFNSPSSFLIDIGDNIACQIFKPVI